MKDVQEMESSLKDLDFLIQVQAVKKKDLGLILISLMSGLLKELN